MMAINPVHRQTKIDSATKTAVTRLKMALEPRPILLSPYAVKFYPPINF